MTGASWSEAWRSFIDIFKARYQNRERPRADGAVVLESHERFMDSPGLAAKGVSGAHSMGISGARVLSLLFGGSNPQRLVFSWLGAAAVVAPAGGQRGQPDRGRHRQDSHNDMARAGAPEARHAGGDFEPGLQEDERRFRGVGTRGRPKRRFVVSG